MFFFKGEYASAILINGVPKLIAKIGVNQVLYNCETKRIERVGQDDVVYDEVLRRIAKIGELRVEYDAVTGRMTKIGSLFVIYDVKGLIIRIGDSQVFYADEPTHYEAVQGKYYSPIHETVLSNVGLWFEAAHRVKMDGFIAALGNDSSIGKALFLIRYKLQEQAEKPGLFEGYSSAALEGGAIKKVAQLLCHEKPTIRSKARKVLLVFPKSVKTHDFPSFTQQLKASSLLIVNATINSMQTAKDKEGCGEIREALEVLCVLPFADHGIQSLMSEKNMVPLLKALRITHSDLHDIIDKNIELILTPSSQGTARSLADELTEEDIKSVVENEQQTTLDQSINPLVNQSLVSSSPALPSSSQVTVDQLKAYYGAHSMWSKQKKHIFKNGAELDGVVGTLKTRAEQRPGYASDKTLNHFKLK